MTPLARSPPGGAGWAATSDRRRDSFSATVSATGAGASDAVAATGATAAAAPGAATGAGATEGTTTGAGAAPDR